MHRKSLGFVARHRWKFIAVLAIVVGVAKYLFFTTFYYQNAFNATEGPNFWLRAYTDPFWVALFRKDFNYTPLLLRSLSLLIVRGFGINLGFPIVFKYLASCTGVSLVGLILTREFRFLSFWTRLALFFIIALFPSPEFLTPINQGYHSLVAMLFLFLLYSRTAIPKRALGWLALVPFVVSAKSTLYFLFVPCFCLSLWMGNKSRRHRLAWGAMLCFFILAIADTMFRPAEWGDVGVAQVSWELAQEFLFLTGSVSLGSFAPLLHPILIKFQTFTIFVFCALGVVALAGASFVGIWALAKKRQTEFCLALSYLGAAAIYFITVRYEAVYTGTSLSWGTFFGAGTNLYRYTYPLYVTGFLLVAHLLTKLPTTKRVYMSWLIWAPQVAFVIVFSPRTFLTEVEGPFQTAVFRHVLQKKPARFCFPILGFPDRRMNHGCALSKKVADRISLEPGQQGLKGAAPEGLYSVVVEIPKVDARATFALEANAKPVAPLVDSPTARYRYYEFERPMKPSEITLANHGDKKYSVNLFYYVKWDD